MPVKARFPKVERPLKGIPCKNAYAMQKCSIFVGQESKYIMMKRIHAKHIILLLAAAWLAFLCPAFAGESGSLPDSLLNEDHLYKYLFTDRHLSERIMAEMRRRGICPDWELDYIEGDLYYNTGRYREALKHYNAALESAHVKGNDTLRMELLHRRISCYDGLHDETGKMHSVERLMELAKRLADRPMESIALFNLGKSLHYQGDKERGYRYMEQGATMMAATDYRLKYDNLRYEYKTLVLFYERDGRHDDVLRILDAWEEIVSASTGGEPAIDGLNTSERKDLCAMRTVALSRLGRKAEAAECYRQYSRLGENLSRNSYLIMPYLFDTEQYDEIFRINLPRERFLVERGDTVNYYMTSVLKFLGYAWRDVGNYRQSSACFERLAVLRDSLKYREQESAAQDYAALYDSREKDLLISQKREENRIAWTVAGCVCLLLVVAGAFGVAIVRKNKEISLKNDTLTTNLNEMTDSREELFRKQEEVMALQEQVAHLSSRLSVWENPVGKDILQPAPDEVENDRKLFDRIKYEIEKRRLFLQKDFDKDAFAKEMNLSSRKMGKLFTVFMGKPLSDYLHDLQLAYALSLLRDNPNWTIDAVAAKCGLSLRTFHRLFTKKFGITPQAYQKKNTEKGF